jgi:hypothetical protein
MRVYRGGDGQGWGGESANGSRGRTPKRNNKESLSAASAATGLQALLCCQAFLCEWLMLP